jgi:hypothetical protein
MSDEATSTLAKWLRAFSKPDSSPHNATQGPLPMPETPSLADRIATLRNLSPRLNATTDEAAAIVTAIETMLTDEFHLGVSAAVEFEDDDDFSLCYGRFDGRFRFYIEETDGDSVSSVAWQNASRENKLRAFEVLPALLDLLVDEAEVLMECADRATEVLEAFRATGS